MSGTVLFQAAGDDGVARVLLDHPGKLNAIDIAMWGELQRGFAALQALPVEAAPRAVIVVNPQRVQVADLKGLLAYLRANPGKLNYASAGNGTSHHLAAELFKLQTKTFITHIPYRGAGPALSDLIAGQVDMMFDGLGSSATHIKGGRIKALAVASPKRAPGFPDVPTSAEGGVPTYQVATWYGLWAPKGTPSAIVDQMQAEMRKAFATPELQATWNGLGTDMPNVYGAEFGRFVSSETKRWAEVVKASGAKMDG